MGVGEGVGVYPVKAKLMNKLNLDINVKLGSEENNRTVGKGACKV